MEEYKPYAESIDAYRRRMGIVRNGIPLQMGDLIIVHGKDFFLASYGEELNETPSVTFKHESELRDIVESDPSEQMRIRVKEVLQHYVKDSTVLNLEAIMDRFDEAHIIFGEKKTV